MSVTADVQDVQQVEGTAPSDPPVPEQPDEQQPAGTTYVLNVSLDKGDTEVASDEWEFEASNDEEAVQVAMSALQGEYGGSGGPQQVDPAMEAMMQGGAPMQGGVPPEAAGAIPHA